MYDLTIDDFPPDRLAAIVHWRNDLAVNKYLRQGIRTLEQAVAWFDPGNYEKCRGHARKLELKRVMPFWGSHHHVVR